LPCPTQRIGWHRLCLSPTGDGRGGRSIEILASAADIVGVELRLIMDRWTAVAVGMWGRKETEMRLF
ncbi:hypothetical protein CLOM_g4971, partial [Closterium sp. NIES-68]